MSSFTDNKSMFSVLGELDNTSNMSPVSPDDTPSTPPPSPSLPSSSNTDVGKLRVDLGVIYNTVPITPNSPSFPRPATPYPKSGTLSDPEFPALGAGSLRKRRDNTYHIDYNMIANRKKENAIATNFARTTSFEQMKAMTDATTKRDHLKCTAACRNVTKRKDDGSYGTCYRMECSYAHSLSSFRYPKCAFDPNCRHMNGRRDRVTGSWDASHRCQYKHDCETVAQFYERTSKASPDLPETDELSRVIPKPKVVATKSRVAQKSEKFTYVKSTPISADDTRRAERAERRKNRPSKWGPPVTIATTNNPFKFGLGNVMGDIGSKSEPETTHKNTTTVDANSLNIRVPREMAEQALKAALAQGHLNVTLTYI